MSLAQVPEIFQHLSPLEAALYKDLESLPNKAERIICVSGDAGGNTARGGFLRWFLLEGVPSADLPIATVKIKQAIVKDIVDLEATTIDLLLQFVQCKFENSIKLSDATIHGFTMIGGTAPEIVADRLTAKGSLRLYQRDASDPQQRPRIGKLRLCGAEIRGNLDMRGCVVGPITDAKDAQKATDDTMPGSESSQGEVKKDGKQESPPLFADGLTVHGNALLGGGFSSKGEIRLNGCNIDRNLDCSGAKLSNPRGYSLSAAGAHIKGSAYFSKTAPWLTYPKRYSFSSEGTLRLDGADIEGDLDCSGGSFSAAAFLAREQQKPPQEDLCAISADGVKVGADVLLCVAEEETDEKEEEERKSTEKEKRFVAHGIISLINAHVGGDFCCTKATFDFPGEEPLTADGIVVEGTTFLDEVVANGVLRFVQASLKQGFYLNGASFETRGGYKSWTEKESNVAEIELGGPSCGIYAPNAVIGGKFKWQKVTKLARDEFSLIPFWLFIPSSKADRVDDDPSSWAVLDRFEVTGCEYGSFVRLSDADAKWRLQELDRQYAEINTKAARPDFALVLMRIRARLWWVPSELRKSLHGELDDAVEKFKPQPYVQLAKTFRAAGYEASARNVLVRLERNKTRYSDITFWHQFWRYILDIFLCYGYAPFRPVVYVLLWALVSALLFQGGKTAGHIVPSKDNQASEVASSTPNPTANSKPGPPVAFNPVVYAVDTLVPIVDLNQKKNWTISTTKKGTSGLGLLLIFNTFFGWLMTTLFAAGVTGLLRTGGDI